MSARRLAAVSGVLALLWLLTVWVLGQHLVSEAYAGRGPGFLVKALSARRDFVGVDHYLGRVRLLALGGAFAIVAGAVAGSVLLKDARQGSPLARRIVLPASATSLAGIRIGACSVTLLSMLLEDPASTATLPGFTITPPGMGLMGIVRQLPGMGVLLHSPSLLHALKAITVLGLIAGVVGFRTRWTLPIALFSALLMGGVLRLYTHYFHTGLLPLYVLAVLAFAPCADAWSVDAWRARRAGRPVASPDATSLRYGFPRFAVWCVLGFSYFAAGTSKLRHGGLGWWDGVNLKAKVLGDALQVGSFDFPFLPVIDKVPLAVFALLGIGTLIVELGMVLVPFSALARRIFPLGVMGLHLGILFAQEILFLDLILIQGIFFDYRRVALPAYRWLAARLPALLDARARPAVVAEERPETLGTSAFSLFPLVYLAIIVLGVELYPISTWPMYSDRTKSTVVEYVLLHGEDASGRTVPIRLEEGFGIFAFSRDFDIIPYAFKPDLRGDLEKTLDAFSNVYNADKSGSARLIAVHFERRQLDFARQPVSERAGELVERFVYRPRG